MRHEIQIYICCTPAQDLVAKALHGRFSDTRNGLYAFITCMSLQSNLKCPSALKIGPGRRFLFSVS